MNYEDFFDIKVNMVEIMYLKQVSQQLDFCIILV